MWYDCRTPHINHLHDSPLFNLHMGWGWHYSSKWNNDFSHDEVASIWNRRISIHETFRVGGIGRKSMQAQRAIKLAQKCQKKSFNKKVKLWRFHKKDLILVYDSHHDMKSFKKLLSKLFGPYIIMKMFFNNNIHELVHLDGKECEKVNHDKLKYFHNGWLVVLRTK